MKSLLLVLALFFTMDMAFSHEDCRIELQPAGVHFVHCPKGTVVDATATNGNITGTPQFPYLNLRTEVRCSRPVIICEDDNYNDLGVAER